MFSSKIEDGFLKLYLPMTGTKPSFVGKIDDESCLHLKASPDFNIFGDKDPQIGIDLGILNSKILDYKYIEINYKGIEVKTTRHFFTRNSKEFIIKDNGNNQERVLKVMPIRFFNIMNAVLGDIAEKESQLDIFDIATIEAKTGDSRIKQVFMKSLERREIKL
jgi:hypothetical protein